MGAVQRALQDVGAVSVGVATTMLPMQAQLLALAPPQPQAPPPAGGSGPRPFSASEAEILVPARPPAAERHPALMLPPERRPDRKRTVIIASAVAFVVAALLTAIATREPALAGTAHPAAPRGRHDLQLPMIRFRPWPRTERARRPHRR